MHEKINQLNAFHLTALPRAAASVGKGENAELMAGNKKQPDPSAAQRVIKARGGFVIRP